MKFRVWFLRDGVFPRPLRALARVPASWREARRARQENPLFALLMRRNLSPGQLTLLASATGFAAILLGILKMNSSSPVLVLQWAVAWWGIGEFLWTWMAADHVFSTITNARNGRQFRDWRLTALNSADIAAALIHGTWLFIALGILACGVVGSALPFDYSWTTGGKSSTASALLWQIGFPLVVTWNHVATTHFASAACCSHAMSGDRGITDWAMALSKICGLLVLIFGTCLALLVACTMATGYRVSELPQDLLLDWRLMLFWLALLAFLPPGFKYGLAWIGTSAAAASFACDADPEELAFPPSSRKQSNSTRGDGKP